MFKLDFMCGRLVVADREFKRTILQIKEKSNCKMHF